MKTAEILLASAAGLFATLPGLNSILSGAGSTPGDEKLFGGVSVAVGVTVLLSLTVFKKAIRRIARRKIVIASTVLIVLGICALATHIGLLGGVVLKYQVDGSPAAAPRYFVFPIAASGQLAGMITTAGGRLATLYRYGPDAVDAALLEGSNPIRIAVAKGVLLLTFGVISASFAGALMLLAYRLDS